MLDLSHLYEDVLAAVGPDGVSRAHTSAIAIDGVTPGLVVTPGTVAELQGVLRAAAAHGASVTARGNGSKMGLGSPPSRVDVLLSLARLDEIVDYDVPNLTLVCQAGMTLRAIEDATLVNRQLLALDPPFVRQATVGGIVSANSSGPHRMAYGAARDLVLGMKVVLASGDLLAVGGRTVKNVAGYDLDKLFIGSLGTLGIIVEVNFRLLPVPEERATVLAAFPALSSALDVASHLRTTQLLPGAVEVLDARALETCGLGRGTNALMVAFEGVSEAVARQKSVLAGLCEQSGSPGVDILEAGAEAAAWEAVRDLALRVGARSTGAVAIKTSVPLSQLSGVCQQTVSAARRAGLPLCLDVRAGSGMLYGWLEGQSGDEARQAAIVAELRAAAVAAGGSLVVEAAPREVKAAGSVWGEPGSDFAAMQAIKASLDPQMLLNPGRFLGGI